MLPDLGTKLLSIYEGNKPLHLINCAVLSIVPDAKEHCLVVFKIGLDEYYMGSVIVKGDQTSLAREIQRWGGIIRIEGKLRPDETYTTKDGQTVVPIFGEIHPQMVTQETDISEQFSENIDPHFVNRRKSFSVFGNQFYQQYKILRDKDEDQDAQFFNNRLLCNLALRFCKNQNVKTLAEVLQAPKMGEIFCSIDVLAGNEDVYGKERIRNRIELPFDYGREVFLDFGVEHFVASTGVYRQSYRNRVAVVGYISKVSNTEVIVDPIIMGDPVFDLPLVKNDEDSFFQKHRFTEGTSWFEGYSKHEVFVENIAEFSGCKDIETVRPDEWARYMQSTPEREIKLKLCEILGTLVKKDWAGEQNDVFTSDIHIEDTRLTAAFLLKGPASGKYFSEMQPSMLGKNADQIYRLAQSPAQLLVIQHCHYVGEAVRATLQHFVVAPHNPRQFCIMDGKDTYRVLKAYNQL